MFKAVTEIIIEAKCSPKATKPIQSLPHLPARSMLLELMELLSHIASATDALQGNSVTSSLILYQVASCFDGI